LKKFAIDPGLNPYYCLGYNSNTKQTECAPIPTDLTCDSSVNKEYLPNQFHLFKSKSSKVDLSTCQKDKALIDSGKYCKIYDDCYSEKLDDCSKATGGLYSNYGDCVKGFIPTSCDATKPCGNNLFCINKQCYKQETLFETEKSCTNDNECTINGSSGACVTAFSKTPSGAGVSVTSKKCYTINNTAGAQTTSCGDGTVCTKSDKQCKIESECNYFGGKSICKDGYCWLDDVSMKKYKETPTLFGIQADLQIKKPILEINIPQLKFSDVENQVDDQGFLHLPYIGEYLSAIYKVGMVAISIIGVIMIIVVGVKITVMGGEERVAGFKKIGQIVIGLFIAWGSYTILYNINPDLVNFSALKVKYIEPIELQTISLTNSDLMDAAIGENSPDKYKYFTKCPVNLTQPIYFADGTTSLIPDLKKKPAVSSLPKNIPRRLEFHEKMVTQQILKGSMVQRVAMATEAAAQCQIQYENCGVGTTNVYALAAATGGSYGASASCLQHAKNTKTSVACNSLGINKAYSPKTMQYDATGLKTSYGLKVTQLTRGMVCNAKCSKKIWPEPCFSDPAQATAKLVSILKATGEWDPNWINKLQPGDYYMIVNWNDYCPGTHSALFLGWKDPVEHIAWVQMGDAGNFIRVGTKKLGKEAVIQISRPKEK